MEYILTEILVSEFRYCMSSPNDPGVSAERNAVIVAKKAVKRIGQSSSKGSQKNSIVGGVAVGLWNQTHDRRSSARPRSLYTSVYLPVRVLGSTLRHAAPEERRKLGWRHRAESAIAAHRWLFTGSLERRLRFARVFGVGRCSGRPIALKRTIN